MYGLINNITAADGKRETLIEILLENAYNMRGCLSYVIAEDVDDPNGVWVTEVWDDQDSQRASLEMESVKDAIRRAMPAVETFTFRTTTKPIGGEGIPQPSNQPATG